MSSWSDSASNESTRRYRDNDKHFSGVGHYEWEKSDDGWKERNTERTKSVAASKEWWDNAAPREDESQEGAWATTIAINEDGATYALPTYVPPKTASTKKRRTGGTDGTPSPGASSSMGPCGSSGIDGTQFPGASAAPDGTKDSWEE